jgi:Zn-dependent protease
MDIFINIWLVVIGVVVFCLLLIYIAVIRVALGRVLQKPTMRRVDRSQCPEYLKKFLEIEEKKLKEMGFNFLFCVFLEYLVTRENTHQYTFVYYHPGNKTYARLTASEIMNKIKPWEVSFRTEFTNGKRLITSNGTRHMFLGTKPNTIFTDSWAPSLEKQLELHLQQLALMNEGFIKEYSEKMNPNDMVRQDLHLNHHYIDKLEREGYIYRIDEGIYKLKIMAALRYVWQLFGGTIKQMRLEQKHAGKQEPLEFELPVELEVKTYLKFKDAYRQPLRETRRNIFHLVLVLLIFAVPVGLILNFKIAAVLVIVVLLHELGHLVVMHWLGFKNFRISIVPFTAAGGVSGEKDIPAYKKVLAYFAGPFTGLLAAFLLVVNLPSWNIPRIPLEHSHWETASLALMLLFFINYFNLIPIVPLDGGRIFNIVLPFGSRFFKLRVIFNTLGIMGLLLTALIFSMWELFIGLILFLYIAREYYFPKPIMKWVKNELKNNAHTYDKKNEKDWLKKIFLRLRQHPYQKYNFLYVTAVV